MAGETTSPQEIIFTGSWQEDYLNLSKWRNLLLDGIDYRQEPELQFQRAIGELEKLPWKYRLETEKGSKYFITASGIVLRLQMVEPEVYDRLQPVTRLIGFVSDSFALDYQEMIDHVFSCKTASIVSSNDSSAARFKFNHLSPEPEIGLHVLDYIPDGNCKGLARQGNGSVEMTYDPGTNPLIHFGNRIVKKN